MSRVAPVIGWSRREFLAALGAAGLSRYVGLFVPGSVRADENAISPLGKLTGSPRFRVLRPRDLLYFELELLNLEVVRTSGRSGEELHIVSNGANGFIILHFTGQHIAEQAIWDRSGQKEPATGGQSVNTAQHNQLNDAPAPLTYRLWNSSSDPGDSDLAFLQRAADEEGNAICRESSSKFLHGLAGAWLSGPSQLVFELPQRLTPVRFNLDELIRICAEDLDLVVAPSMTIEAGPDNGKPSQLSIFDGEPEPALGHHPAIVNQTEDTPYTLVEFPALLNLSPYRSARWRQRPRPADGRSELWSFELEPPDLDPLRGPPRTVQPRGHLFAFGWRSDKEARWPLSGKPTDSDKVNPSHKYLLCERPKIALYEATRKLLVKQLLEDNGDIVAERFRLSSLGATARLQYTPAIEVPSEGNQEGAVTPDIKPQGDEGNLTEWQQKTETGRDFYSKESFSGYWMPFRFRAEVVTITERILSSANDPPGQKPPPGQASTTDQDLVNLRDDESQLTAFLVARKFGRIRGSTTIVFPDSESADFSDLPGIAGRSVGLKQVDVLVERTPILANQPTKDLSLDDQRTAIANGDDAIVDDGSGVNAARQIFWPRVQDLVTDENGQPALRLIPYKFPVKYTFLDGSDLTTEIAMLFVPTLSTGEAFYPHAKAELRTSAIGIKIPLVQPPPPAVVAPGDFGTPDQILNVAEHLKVFLPDSLQSLLAVKADENSSITAGVSAAISEGINLSLGNLPTEIARRVTQARDALKSVADSETDSAGANFKSLLAAFLVAGKQPESAENLEAVFADVGRSVAWGEQITETIGVSQAADRLNRLLVPQPDPVQPMVWLPDQGKFLTAITTATKALKDQLTHVKGLSADGLSDLQKDLNGLGATINAGEAAYLAALRQFLVHWGIWLGSVWQRSDWDDAFRNVVNAVDPAAETRTRLSALQKELQRALLRDAKSIPLPGAANQKVQAPDLPKTVLLLVEGDLRDVLHDTLGQVENLANQNLDALNRFVSGLASALGEERMLLARGRCLLQDYSNLTVGQRKLQVSRLVADAEAHLLFALTHFEDGRIRWENFLQNALSAEELIREARTNTLTQWDMVHKKVRDELNKIVGDSNTKDPKKEVSAGTQSLQQLLMVTNPDRLQQTFNNFASLTGGRLTDDLHDAFTSVSARANQLLTNLQLLAAAETANPADARTALEELFSLSRQLVQRYRSMLESLLRASLDQVRESVGKYSADIAQIKNLAGNFMAYSSRSGGQITIVGWRLGAAAADLVADVQNALDGIEGSAGEAAQKAQQGLRSLRSEVAQELRTTQAVKAETLNNVQIELASVSGRLEQELQLRINTLQKVTQDWVGSVENRTEDLLEYLVATLWGIFAKSEEGFEEVLSRLLSGLGEDKLKDALKAFPAAANAAADLARITGEVENVGDRISQLPTDIQNDAGKKLSALQGKAKDLADALASSLQSRLQHAEGDIIAMAKRAALSLPAPALLSEFQDQTRKAIFQTSQMVFSVGTISQGFTDFLAHPNLQSLGVSIPGLDGVKMVNYAQDYVNNGLRDANRAANDVFAELSSGVATTIAQTAGVADAAAQVQALSREAGNLADAARQQLKAVQDQVNGVLNQLRSGINSQLDSLKQDASKLAVEASSILPVDPKLFNSLPLTSILQAIGSPAELPKTIAHQFPDRIERTFSFSKETQPLNLVVVAFDPVNNCRFRVDSRVTLWLPGPGRAPQPPTYSVRGQLDAFGLEIATLLRVNFVSLSFIAENGSFKCTPRLGKVPADGSGKIDSDSVVEFLGSLAFVNDLRKTLGKLLSDNGLIQRIDGDTIFAGLKIRIPDLTFGVMAVTNLALEISLGLPLGTGPLWFRFSLSDPIETFRLAVTIFAGGGFFGLQLSSQPELCKLDAAFEFGGSLSLNIAIASGSVSVMAGIYYSWSGNSSDLSAYIRVCGNITVLGFIEISIVIYLALEYRSDNGQSQLHGAATITVSVKIGFFSKSFSLTYEKTIAGSASSSDTNSSFVTPAPIFAEISDGINSGRYERQAMLDSERPNFYGPRLPSSGSTPAKSSGLPGSISEQNKVRRFSEAMNSEDFLRYWRAFDDRLTAQCNQYGARKPQPGV